MKLVTFSLPGLAGDRIGAISGARVLDFTPDARLPWRSMVHLLEAGPAAIDQARTVLAEAEAGTGQAEWLALDSVTLGPPVPGARKLFALAGNYAEHIQESIKHAGISQAPRVFMKPPSTVLRGDGAPITLHRYARGVDWEAELAVVIGARARYVDRADALGYVAGYSCFNDVSERKFQVFPRERRTEWDGFFDWLNGKWVDGFGPMGPALVTPEEVGDPQDLDISLTVNGTVQQSANTRQMIFDVATIIEFLSAFCTLEPGDIIATGTPAGVGDAKGVYLSAGDTVQVRIQRVGTLTNPVVAEAPSDGSAG